jgi:hypothetical protein
VASWRRNVTGIVLKLWLREEPLDDGLRGKCCVLLCRRCQVSNCELEYSEKTPHEMAVGGLAKIKAEEERVGLRDEAACLYSQMRGKPVRNEFVGANRILHHVQ